MFRVSKRVPNAEFDVRATLPTREQLRMIAAKLDRALELLRSYAPVRLAHLKIHLPRLLVGATQNLAECHTQAGLCVLKFDYVISPDTSAEDLALTLVHEGTHARLDKQRYRYDERRRARIERLCVTAELIVARRMVDAAPLMNSIQRRLAYDDAFWTDEAFRQRGQAALRTLGVEGRIGAVLGSVVARILTRNRKRGKHAA